MSTLPLHPRPDLRLRVLNEAPDEAAHLATPPRCHSATSPFRDHGAPCGDSSEYVTPPRTAGDFLATETTCEPASLDFDPGEQQTADIIEAVVSPDCSLSAIAKAHGTSFQALTLWLTRPDIAARIDAVENVCARRVRVVAVNHLSHCVEVTSRILKYADWEESHVVYPPNSARHNEARRRTRETALRAARTLIHLANFTPGPRPLRAPSTRPHRVADPDAKARAQQEALEKARKLTEASSIFPNSGSRLSTDRILNPRIPADWTHPHSALNELDCHSPSLREGAGGRENSNGPFAGLPANASPSPQPPSPRPRNPDTSTPRHLSSDPHPTSAIPHPPSPLAFPHSPHKNPP